MLHPQQFLRRSAARLLLLAGLACFASGCATAYVHQVEATAYCGCGQCCGWQRGSWVFLRLNFWNRYVSSGPRAGQHYDGRTAGLTKPRQPAPGLVSLDSLVHPWMIPVRIVFFPWLLLPHPGTIAADTDYFPFGTQIYVPGYGWGIVEDRGSAIKGPNRIDLYYRRHSRALEWGRQNKTIEIILPE